MSEELSIEESRVLGEFILDAEADGHQALAQQMKSLSIEKQKEHAQKLLSSEENALAQPEVSKEELGKIHYRMMFVQEGLKELSEMLQDRDEFGAAGLCESLRDLLKNELSKLELYT